MLFPGERLEPLTKTVSVIVSPAHGFSTDTLLLADFAMPRRGEACADFGTGCGAIPLLWSARAAPAHIDALEIQEDAASMARRSVEYNGMADRITVRCADVRGIAALNPPRGLDLIACNPPYKPGRTGVQNADARRAVARHEVVSDFAGLARAAARLLRFGGRFCCCLRPERLCGAIADLRGAGLEPKRLRFVQQRPQREPSLFLLQAARGGKPGLRVAPVLFIENGSGGWSEEMLRIYGDYKEGHP